jgi:hypothetical protein
MHSTKGGAGLVVVEIRVGPDRSPVDRGVAILAGYAEVAMGITGAPLDGLRDRALRAEPGEQKYYPDHDWAHANYRRGVPDPEHA